MKGIVFPEERLSTSARGLYETVRDLPIVSPHGHCDPRWWAEDAPFPDPAALLVIPDHYVFRMLYSLGVPLEALGIGVAPHERDPRAIFQHLADHWHCFLGTPSREWLEYTLHRILGVTVALSAETGSRVYDEIAERLADPEFRPRALFDRFSIEWLATTDAATDTLAHHDAIRTSGWSGRVIPTFRPDGILNPERAAFRQEIEALAKLTGSDTTRYADYLEAIRQRRAFFRQRGATATDHDVPHLQTDHLPVAEAEALFGKAVSGTNSVEEARRFYGHMLVEMAGMSVDDGLVMQLHAGSTRNTNRALFERYGPDMGADIPKAVDWVGGLSGLLQRHGNNPALTVITFTLDESTYARELAPMAGHWPCLRIGPPWWFHDSPNGIRRYLDRVVETAGYFNLAGFNDDTRAFLSIPARHDTWRRAVCEHLAAQIERGRLGANDAAILARHLCRGAALHSYRLGEGGR